ncbi:MAG: hypothetical protein AAGE37_11660 [Pseudomonadota bacterium]
MTNSVCGRLDQDFHHVPVILIICPFDSNIHLEELCTCQKSSRPSAKRHPCEREILSREIVSDGMTFQLTIECTNDMGSDRAIENLFTSRIPPDCQAVGITLGHHLVTGKHMPAVNLALLSIARRIGLELEATGIVWQPAKLHVDFAHFSEAVEQYAEHHIFPTIVQIALRSPGNGRLETRGLTYFVGREVRTLFSAQQNTRAWMSHFLKITGALISGRRLTNETAILSNAPNNAQLTSYRRDGSVLEFSYAEPIPAGIAVTASQAALGAASRTF